MNYLLHRQKYPNSVVKIPEGLDNLMGDIGREVLRAQPIDEAIYEFIAIYLESLMRTRETLKTTEELVKGIVDRVTDIAQHLSDLGVDWSKASTAAGIIQNSFKKHLLTERKKQYENIEWEFKKTEVLKELILKCNFTNWEIMKTKSTIFDAYQKCIAEYMKAIDTTIIPKSFIRPIVEFKFERYFDDTFKLKIFNKAAIKIQTAFRLYLFKKNFVYVKKTLQDIKQTERNLNIPFLLGPKEMKVYGKAADTINTYFHTPYDNLAEVEKAVITIQRFYRKFKKENWEMGLGPPATIHKVHPIPLKAVENIQHAYRKHIIYKYSEDEEDDLRLTIINSQDEKVIKILDLKRFSGQKSKDSASFIQNIYRNHKRVRKSAAVTIQRAYRKHIIDRKKIKGYIQKKRQYHKS